MSTKAEYMTAKKKLMQLLEGKNEKAINFVISQFEGLANAEKENIVRSGLVDAIIREMKQIPNKNMQTLLMLIQQFRKGEILQVTDSAYDELQTDLKKRLIFEFQSWFWAKKIPFKAHPKSDNRFSFLIDDIDLKVTMDTPPRYFWLNVEVTEKSYEIHFEEVRPEGIVQRNTFKDVEKCFAFLLKSVLTF